VIIQTPSPARLSLATRNTKACASNLSLATKPSLSGHNRQRQLAGLPQANVLCQAQVFLLSTVQSTHWSTEHTNNAWQRLLVLFASIALLRHRRHLVTDACDAQGDNTRSACIQNGHSPACPHQPSSSMATAAAVFACSSSGPRRAISVPVFPSSFSSVGIL
jgi:hypothetical protein